MARFRSDDEMVDYTPTSAVAAGDVIVQGDLVAVATRPIAANALGALACAGVFDFAKAAGSGTALTAGAKVYWNASSEVVSATDGGGTYKYLGKVVAAVGDDDETVRVRLDQ